MHNNDQYSQFLDITMLIILYFIVDLIFYIF